MDIFWLLAPVVVAGAYGGWIIYHVFKFLIVEIVIPTFEKWKHY